MDRCTRDDEPVYLASYKGTRAGWRGMGNRFIRWATRSIYSHSEICLGDPFSGPAMCLSSEGGVGVRLKRMQLDPAKWDVVRMPEVSETAFWYFAVEHKGEPYDWVGAARSVLPFVGREHPRAWFCSEVVAQVRGLSDPWRMYPGVLHAVVTSKKQCKK